MKVLVFCENSDVVGSAFRARGHDVTSSDLEPSEGSPNHYQGDGRWLLKEPWDLVIAHPPCQLTSLNQSHPANRRRLGFWVEFADAVQFFQDCLAANAPRVAVENPLMHHWAKRCIRKYDFLDAALPFRGWLFEADRLLDNRPAAPYVQP